MTPQGVYDQVYGFTTADGSDPSSTSGLAAQGMDGVLYGELFDNLTGTGANYNGAIYALDLNLPKPLPRAAALTPAVEGAGSAVLIYGSGLLGATAVRSTEFPRRSPCQVAFISRRPCRRAPQAGQSPLRLRTEPPQAASVSPLNNKAGGLTGSFGVTSSVCLL